MTAPREQPGLDEEVDPTGGCVDREMVSRGSAPDAAMTNMKPRMTDTPPARSIGHCMPNCARRRRAVTSCAAPETAAQTPKTARTSATLPVAATPSAAAAMALVAAPVSSTRRADPCWVRASISDATTSISG